MILTQIEKSINTLSYDELLYLLEKIIRSLKQRSTGRVVNDNLSFEKQIAMMAADPEIQAELHKN
jgi:hypothetical protein